MSYTHWNYRVIKHKHNHNGSEYISYAIHEVYYENDKPIKMSVEPSTPYVDTPDELIELIQLFSESTKKPILNYK